MSRVKVKEDLVYCNCCNKRETDGIRVDINSIILSLCKECGEDLRKKLFIWGMSK